MGDSGNPPDVPNQFNTRPEVKFPAQWRQDVRPIESSDQGAHGTSTPNNSYRCNNLQHMDDMNSYEGEFQRKAVTSNRNDFHRQKSYEQNYTSTSGAKSLHSVEDACQYVIQMGKIWKVPNVPNGNEFLNTLVDVIQHGYPQEYVTEHSLTNEQGETIYVMVVVRAISPQQREVFHSFQQLADSYVTNINGRNVEVSQHHPVDWLRCKAAESLRVHTKVIQSFNMPYYGSSPQIPQTRSKKPISMDFSFNLYFLVELIFLSIFMCRS
jgi:hypothetical protein